MNLIIPDGSWRPGYRSVLAMTRSLGRGHRVYVASTTPRLRRLQRLLKSRYCADVLSLPDPRDAAAAFVRAVNGAARRYELDALLPYSDEIAAVASLHADELDVAVPLPAYPVFERALDKRSTVEAAQALGIPVPRTAVVDRPEAVEALAAERELSFPAVVKPRRRAIATEARASCALVSSSTTLCGRLPRSATGCPHTPTLLRSCRNSCRGRSTTAASCISGASSRRC